MAALIPPAVPYPALDGTVVAALIPLAVPYSPWTESSWPR